MRESNPTYACWKAYIPRSHLCGKSGPSPAFTGFWLCQMNRNLIINGCFCVDFTLDVSGVDAINLIGKGALTIMA